MANRSYSREEMEEILRRAAERTHTQEDAVRHDDLVAAAREVGIDETAIDHVVEELGGERETTALVTRHVARTRSRFWRRASTLAIVATFLATVDYLTPGGPWAQWPLVALAFVIAMSARSAFLPPSEEQIERLTRAERKRREREAKREARRRAAEAWTQRWRELGEESARAANDRAVRRDRFRNAEKQIDRAIEEGVTALVEALGKRALVAAERMTAPPAPPRSDFDRYVARKKTGAAPAPDRGPEARPAKRVAPHDVLVTPPPRTRVLEEEDEADVEPEPARSARRRSR